MPTRKFWFTYRSTASPWKARWPFPRMHTGLVLFVHGSGSSRFSPRNNFVARELRNAGLGTLLIDLLTRIEDQDYERRFDIPLLTQRVLRVTGWLQAQAQTKTTHARLLWCQHRRGGGTAGRGSSRETR